MTSPFTAEHLSFRDSARQWVERELKPHALEWDRAGIFPRDIFKRAGELGYLGINHAEAYGGSALDYWYVAAFCEALSYSENAGVNLGLLVQSQMATPIINEIGTEEQKREFLAPALAGEKIAALGVSEPGMGSDVAGLQTTARVDGGDYVIQGSKMWITNGTRADFITLAVRTGEVGYGGISLLTFPTDVKGFGVSRKLDKIGHLSSDTAVLYFDDCRVPRRYLLGQENEGFYHIMTNFQGERLVGALMAVYAMERLVDSALEWGRQRKAFGREILRFQVWKHKFVELRTAIEAAKWLSYRAVELFDAKRDPVREISMAKLFAGDLAQRVAYECQQFFGGMGYVEETYVARAFRDVRLIPIGGGTSEVMKEIISKIDGM